MKNFVFLAFLLSSANGFGLTNIKKLKRQYDFIVVGGGTAGAIVASRLSENPKVEVLLLEAGPSDKSVPATEVPLSWTSLIGSKTDWGFFSEPLQFGGQELVNKKTRLSAARILGGSSSHNGLAVVRGNREDFDRWRQLGNKGWGYKDVLYYFKKMENMKDPLLASNGFHGVGGPFTIIKANKTKLSAAFIDAGKELGFKPLSDYNGAQQEGYALFQHNVKDGKRSGTAESYIWSCIGRRNFDVITGASVTKVAIAKKRAVGVYFIHRRKKYYVKVNKEVILSGGALNSPKLLMLSGIGPKEHLKRMGIPVIADLPVGNGLQDHVFTYLDYFINKPLSILPRTIFTFESMSDFVFQRSGTWTENGYEGVAFLKSKWQPKQDKFPYLQLIQSKSLPGGYKEGARDFLRWVTMKEEYFKVMHGHELGRDGVTIYISHNHPRSTGTVRLKSKDPFDSPAVDMNILKNPKDVDDLLYGIKVTQKLMKTKPYQYLGAKLTFPLHPACRKYGYGYDSEAYWKCFIRQKTYSFMHYSSSCRMSSDKTGVVDPRLRVKGIKGLRIADASIMPTTISGSTMTACLMIGEKAADMIKEEHGLFYKY